VLFSKYVLVINVYNRPEQAITMLREVLSADQWEHFTNSSLGRKDSGWLKYVLSSGKSDLYLSELERKQLQYILKTAPTWDRYNFLIKLSSLFEQAFGANSLHFVMS
jgi:hypothetical protein